MPYFIINSQMETSEMFLPHIHWFNFLYHRHFWWNNSSSSIMFFIPSSWVGRKFKSEFISLHWKFSWRMLSIMQYFTAINSIKNHYICCFFTHKYLIEEIALVVKQNFLFIFHFLFAFYAHQYFMKTLSKSFQTQCEV